jgi:cell division protein FtsB
MRLPKHNKTRPAEMRPVDKSGSPADNTAATLASLRDTEMGSMRPRTTHPPRSGPRFHRKANVVTDPTPAKRPLQLPTLAEAAKGRVFLWRRRAATVAVGALALVMAYGVVFGHNGLTAFAHKREDARSLQQQAQQLKKENDRLQGHVDRLQNDPSAIEHEAREELHYTRSGEVIYTLPNTKPSTAPAPKP